MPKWEVTTEYMCRDIDADHVRYGDNYVNFYKNEDVPGAEGSPSQRRLIAKVSGDFVIRQTVS